MEKNLASPSGVSESNGSARSEMHAVARAEMKFSHESDRYVYIPKSSRLSFSDECLNSIAKCVRVFLDGSFEWYHLVLDHAIDFDRWTLRIFGRDEKERYHFVVMCPEGRFEKDVWEKLDAIDKCASLIHEPIELVRVLVRTSRLPVANYELPRHSQWVLASMWKGGLRTLFDYENEEQTPPRFCFPVRKHFRPTKKGPTRYFLYTRDGSPLYFEKDYSLLDLNDDEWTDLQLKLGNELIRNDID